MDYWTMPWRLMRPSHLWLKWCSACVIANWSEATRLLSLTKSSIMNVASWTFFGLHERYQPWGVPIHEGKCEFQHELWHSEAKNDTIPSETLASFPTRQWPQTHLQEGYSKGLAKLFPDLNLLKHLWGILKWTVEEHKVSNIQELRSSGATCAAQMYSVPKRVKAVLKMTVVTQNMSTMDK